jgi:hypothetical protein
MMNDEPMPFDFEQIEHELAAALRSDPPPALGNRIASAVRGELRRKRTAERWNFALATAATFLIWANLSLCAVSVTDFNFRPERQAPPVERMAQEIQTLLPELTREQAYRQAALMSAGASIVPLPKIAARNVPKMAIFSAPSYHETN